MGDNLYENFYDPTEDFKREPRYFCYEMALELYKEGTQKNDEEMKIKSILLLLYTWNFAAKETKKLTFEVIRELLISNKDNLQRLEGISIENIPDNLWDIVKTVFENFKAKLGQTGASKALSLINPNLFVMWDTKIRKRLGKELIKGIDNGENAEHYIIFLKGIKEIIEKNKIRDKLPNGVILAKKIDEYNYVKIVMKL